MGPCLRVSTASISAAGSRIFPMSLHSLRSHARRTENTQISTASVPAAGFFRGSLSDTCGFPRRAFQQQYFFMGAFTSDVMSVEWHAGVSMLGVSV